MFYHNYRFKYVNRLFRLRFLITLFAICSHFEVKICVCVCRNRLSHFMAPSLCFSNVWRTWRVKLSNSRYKEANLLLKFLKLSLLFRRNEALLWRYWHFICPSSNHNYYVRRDIFFFQIKSYFERLNAKIREKLSRDRHVTWTSDLRTKLIWIYWNTEDIITT